MIKPIYIFGIHRSGTNYLMSLLNSNFGKIHEKNINNNYQPLWKHSVVVDSTIGDYFNIGGVGETTIKELATKVIAQTGSASTLKHIPYSEAYPAGFEDMQRRVPDISKIKKAIDWEPKHSLGSIIDSVAVSLKS